jgi:hypothetical protein
MFVLATAAEREQRRDQERTSANYTEESVHVSSIVGKTAALVAVVLSPSPRTVHA